MGPAFPEKSRWTGQGSDYAIDSSKERGRKRQDVLAHLPLMQLYLEFLEKQQDFLVRHPNPWLVFEREVPKSPARIVKTKVYEGDGGQAQGSVTNDQAVAFEVIKGALNAFGLGVTLGRTWNNDLALPDERVSRFHAFFQQRDEVWTVTDAGSRNGTVLAAVASRRASRSPSSPGPASRSAAARRASTAQRASCSTSSPSSAQAGIASSNPCLRSQATTICWPPLRVLGKPLRQRLPQRPDPDPGLGQPHRPRAPRPRTSPTGACRDRVVVLPHAQRVGEGGRAHHQLAGEVAGGVVAEGGAEVHPQLRRWPWTRARAGRGFFASLSQTSSYRGTIEDHAYSSACSAAALAIASRRAGLRHSSTSASSSAFRLTSMPCPSSRCSGRSYSSGERSVRNAGSMHQRVGIPDSDLVGHRLLVSVEVRDDHREPGGHRLDHAQPEGLLGLSLADTNRFAAASRLRLRSEAKSTSIATRSATPSSFAHSPSISGVLVPCRAPARRRWSGRPEARSLHGALERLEHREQVHLVELGEPGQAEHHQRVGRDF